jgi:hypothetical protein
MNSPLGPKSQRTLRSTIRKRWRLEGWPLVKWTVWGQHHNIHFVVFAAAIGFRLRRIKLWRRWAFGGHPSMVGGPAQVPIAKVPDPKKSAQTPTTLETSKHAPTAVRQPSQYWRSIANAVIHCDNTLSSITHQGHNYKLKAFVVT